MNQAITALATAGLLMLGAVASAQDSSTTPDYSQGGAQQSPPQQPQSDSGMGNSSANGQPMSKRQMMKECMDRQAAKNDGSTHSQMKKACKEEMKNGSSGASSGTSTNPGTTGNPSDTSSGNPSSDTTTTPR